MSCHVTYRHSFIHLSYQFVVITAYFCNTAGIIIDPKILIPFLIGPNHEEYIKNNDIKPEQLLKLQQQQCVQWDVEPELLNQRTRFLFIYTSIFSQNICYKDQVKSIESMLMSDWNKKKEEKPQKRYRFFLRSNKRGCYLLIIIWYIIERQFKRNPNGLTPFKR